MTKIQNPTRRACALSQQEPVYDLEVFLVPMLLRGNVYHMGCHAGAWEPGKRAACCLVAELLQFFSATTTYHAALFGFTFLLAPFQ